MKKLILIIASLGLIITAKAQCSLGTFSVNSPTSITTTSMTVSWGSSTGADEYQLQISSNGGSSYTNSGSRTTSTSRTVTGLTAGNTYVFRVYSYCDYSFYDPEIGEVIPITNIQQSSNTRSATTKPNAPTSNSASSVASTSFTARWYTTNGATSYELDVSTCASFCSYVTGYNDKQISGGSTTSSSVTGLTPGVKYYYRVRAKTSGGTSSNSSTRNIETLASTPVSNVASNVTQSSFQANWSAATGADDYRLYVSTISTFLSHLSGYNGKVVTGTSSNVTGLTAGTTYYYRLVSANTDDDLSAYSSTQTVEVIPSTPTISAATSVSQAGFTANWSNVSGEDNYLLDVSQESDFSNFVTGYENLEVTSTSEVLTGLNSGETYYYRVRSENGGGISPYSGTTSILLIPANPGVITVSSITQSSFDLNWDAVTGSTEYLLDISVENDFSSFVSGYENKELSATNESVVGLQNGTTYHIRLRSQNATGVSGNSDVVTASTIPANPTVESASLIDQSSFTANWTSIEGATSYLLDVSQTSDFSTFISGYEQKSVSTNSEIVTDLNSGETYFYRVSSQNAGGVSGQSGTEEVQLIPADPGTLNISNITQSGLEVSWDAVVGADQYLLDISLNGDFSSFITGYENKTVASTSEVVSGLESGTTYYFRLRSNNGTGSSGYSGTANTLTIPANPTVSSASSIAQTGFTANWNSIVGADEYLLDVSQDADFTTFAVGYEQKSIATTSEALTGLNSGEVYYFRVIAQNSTGASDYSGTETVQLIPNNPGSVVLSNIGQSGFDLSWDAIVGADEYLLDVSLSSDFSDYVAGYENKSVTTTSQSVADLASGLTYYVRLSASNTTGESDNSDVESALLIPADPEALDATSLTATSFTANWTSTTGADSYFLDISQDESFGSFIDGYENMEINSTSELVTGLVSGDVYFYRLRANNSSGTSGNSVSIEVVLAPGNPSGLVDSNIGQNGYSLSWDEVNGADNYLLDISAESNFSTFVQGYESLQVSGVTMEVTGLDAGEVYFARLRSNNATATSDYSESLETNLIPANPISIAISDVTDESFTINWDAITGADQYLLDVSESESFDSYLVGYEGFETNSTSVTMSELMSGDTYHFRLKSKNASGESDYSDAGSALLISSNPSSLEISNTQQTTSQLDWESQLGAESYLLDLAYDEAFTDFVLVNEAVSTNAYSFSNLETGQVYFARVRSVNTTGISDYSASATFQTIPADPVLASETEVTQTSFTANWETVFGVENNFVEVSQSEDFTEFLEDYNHIAVSENLISITGLNPGEVYYYRISSGNDTGESGYSSVGEVLLIPGDPQSPATSNISQSSFELSWSDVVGRDNFILEVSETNTFDELLENYAAISVDDITQSITGLQSGTTYYSRIKSKNATGESGYSEINETKLIPADPVSINASEISQTSFIANWEAVEGEDSYLLDVSENSDFSTYLSGYKDLVITSINSDLTGLTTGATYFYRVSSVNGSGESSHSNVVEVQLIPANPGSQSYSEITQTSLDITWDALLGATSYLIDIALDENFTNVVAKDLTVSEPSISIDNLVPGTTYYTRLRAQNETGISGYSQESSVILVPANPISAAGSAITQTEFTASWEAVIGVDSYLFDVSQQADFSVFLAGFEGKVVTGTELQITLSELNPGETYFYRVRAQNANGTSGNSESQEVLLVPSEVESVTANVFDYESFTINWDAVTGANSYIIDVSTNANFLEILPAYDQLEVFEEQLVLMNLEVGVEYYIRIKASNSSGQSDYFEMSAETLPEIPQNFHRSDRDHDLIEVRWDEAAGAVAYEIYVASDGNFENLLDGFPRTTVTVNSNVEGLEAETGYYFRIRSINASGYYSEFAAAQEFRTTALDGSVELPKISNVNIDNGNLSFNTTSANGEIKNVNFYHKKITDQEFTGPIVFEPTNGQVNIEVNPDWIDVFGWEYSIEVTDEVNEIKVEEFIQLSDPGTQILPIQSFGKKPENYQIISVPYELEGGSIESILIPLMQGYDRSKWRLVRYQDGQNLDFSEGVGLKPFERGKSYWFISDEKIELNLGGGSTYDVSDVRSSFSLTLKQGFNQISNPFPFEISWYELMQYNDNPTAIDQYLVYNQSAQSLQVSDQFLPYGGGFVHSRESITIEIPISLINGLEPSEGRIENSGRKESSDSWELPISITQGELINQLTAIGMNDQATDGKDQFDLVTPPKFVVYSNMSTNVQGLDLSQDIVSTMDEYTWEFHLDHNQGDKPIQLNWNNEVDGYLYLYAHESQQLINMNDNEQITVSADVENISIYYSKNEPLHLGDLTQPEFGQAYPNPSKGHVNIPFNFSFNDSSPKASITIHNQFGQKVYQKSIDDLSSGIQEFSWEGISQSGDEVSDGLYYFTIQYLNKGTLLTNKGKILIQH